MTQVGFKPTYIRIRQSQTLTIIIIFTDCMRKINCVNRVAINCEREISNS